MPALNAISETQLRALLQQIETGAVALTPEGEPQEIYAANVKYSASNGWHIIVFNDANEWDYIDSIEDADGNVIKYVVLASGQQTDLCLFEYQPSQQTAWERYRIPGYMKYRCVRCGAKLHKKLRGMPFLCDGCA